MLDVKLKPTLMVLYPCLTQEGSYAFYNPFIYRLIVGALQYLIITRPELSFSVNKVPNLCTIPRIIIGQW